MYKILVIGAGFTGATIARQLADRGYEIEVVDSRDHIGGNAYDTTQNGIRYHKYGPHIFHTNNQKVFDWLSEFTLWRKYHHQVYAIDPDGKYMPFPPNRETWLDYGKNKEKLIDVFFRPYTKKMWGMELEEITPDILNRVPIDTDSFTNYYFNDKFQYMPKHGYTEIFNRILDHKNIKIILNTTIKNDENLNKYYHYVFNCSPIDDWYNYDFGELPYRSIKFYHMLIPSPKFYSVSTVNFTHDGRFTRCTEWKNFPNHGTDDYNTLLTYEEPCDYKSNNMERYYPVKDIKGKNREIYKKYASLDHGNMMFVGRCGQYVYIDMDQAINSGLQIAEKFINGRIRT